MNVMRWWSDRQGKTHSVLGKTCPMWLGSQQIQPGPV